MKTFLALVLVVCFPALSFAQDAPEPEYEEITEFDFEDDEVHGSRNIPDGIRIFGQDPKEGFSLIQLRTSFYGELVRSAEGLPEVFVHDQSLPIDD